MCLHKSDVIITALLYIGVIFLMQLKLIMCLCLRPPGTSALISFSSFWSAELHVLPLDLVWRGVHYGFGLKQFLWFFILKISSAHSYVHQSQLSWKKGLEDSFLHV